mmetsp:Transcript_31655/g.74284  ORF Transcript_31655/g.74284 Transcript_31655/m.74284 type:complete len:257 (-) Transcript_31655:43-813(-)
MCKTTNVHVWGYYPPKRLDEAREEGLQGGVIGHRAEHKPLPERLELLEVALLQDVRLVRFANYQNLVVWLQRLELLDEILLNARPSLFQPGPVLLELLLVSQPRQLGIPDVDHRRLQRSGHLEHEVHHHRRLFLRVLAISGLGRKVKQVGADLLGEGLDEHGFTCSRGTVQHHSVRERVRGQRRTQVLAGERDGETLDHELANLRQRRVQLQPGMRHDRVEVACLSHKRREPRCLGVILDQDLRSDELTEDGVEGS